jgi:hypothetical protein
MANGVAVPDITYVTIKCTTEIPMAVIRGYLDGRMEFDNTVLMAISKYYRPSQIEASV